jgi:selenide,water dikinase
MSTIKLTEYSHGAGCGCKISPEVLGTILASSQPAVQDPRLLVGNSSRDDAAVYDWGDGQAVISTTDFFMPIVDDPFDFGRIAATNAISDIYAMGGTPLLAIAILGWPVERLPADVAAKVVEGGRAACLEAGIGIAGGHSIDAPEPIFGLAVTGRVAIDRLKRNDTAQPGDRLFLTKPLGIGMLTTAEKQKKLRPEHRHLARDWMLRLNSIGATLAAISGVHAMTDVTGFGLAGHLLEMAQGSGLAAQLSLSSLPLIEEAKMYQAMGTVPGGTRRNHASYGEHLAPVDDAWLDWLCDPQTSGGLLVAVAPETANQVSRELEQAGLCHQSIGQLVERTDAGPWIRFDTDDV